MGGATGDGTRRGAGASGISRLASSPDPDVLLPRRGAFVSARSRLVGTPLDEAASRVAETRRVLDEKR